MRQPQPAHSAAPGYTPVQIALHWGVALLVLSQFLTSDAMSGFFRELIRATEERPALGAAVWHFGGGACVLACMVARLVARMIRGVPPDSPASAGWDRILSRVVHFALYATLFALPVTGLGAYLIPSRAWGNLHERLTTVLLALIALHILGALYHQFMLKDGLIRRMMVPIRPERHIPPPRPR